MGLIRDAFGEGASRARKPGKTKAQKLQEIRGRRQALDSKNKLNREYSAEKSRFREAKLESFGLGKARRKKFAKGISKLAKANSKRFNAPKKRKRGKGGRGRNQFEMADLF